MDECHNNNNNIYIFIIFSKLVYLYDDEIIIDYDDDIYMRMTRKRASFSNSFEYTIYFRWVFRNKFIEEQIKIFIF